MVHGDVDINGDLVDELILRIGRAVGPHRSIEVGRAEQVGLVLSLLSLGRLRQEAMSS